MASAAPASPSEPAPAHLVDQAERLRRQMVLAVVMMGSFMAVLDITIVNVVIPEIMASFGVNVKEVKWVSTAFLIAQAVVMPSTGWLGRRLGLGRLYFLELLVFTAGSALCAMAWSLEMLVFARVLQAIGGGGIMTTSLSIITDTFPPGERGRAMGIWGVGFMVGSASGPTLGGLLSEWFNWRAVFFVNLPIGVLALMFTTVALQRGQQDTRSPFHWRGYLALSAFLIVGLLTVEYGQDEGWDAGLIRLGMAGTAVFFALFLLLNWGSPHPLLPLRLFRSRDFTMVMLISVVRSIPMFAPLFMVPLFLQNVQGRDTITTGLLLIPSAVTQMVCMPLVGSLTDRYGPRWITVIGVFLCANCMYLFSYMDPVAGIWPAIYPQFWRGVGISILFSSVNTAGLNAVPARDAGTCSWMLSLLMYTGGSVAIALLGTWLQSSTLSQMDLLGTGALLHGALPPELLDRARGLGYGVFEAEAAARGVLLGHVADVAVARAYSDRFVQMALWTMAAVVPAWFISSGRAGARRAA